MGRVGSYVVLDNQFNSLESDECVEVGLDYLKIRYISNSVRKHCIERT